MFFDNKDYQTSNTQVANILSVGKGDNDKKEEGEEKEAAVIEATADQLEAQWGGDDEIDIDMGDEILAEAEKVEDGA